MATAETIAPTTTSDLVRFEANSRAQLLFMRSRAPRLLFSSAYGKGKTRALCEKADTLCRLFPGTRVVLARKTLASMWQTTIQVYEQEVMDEALRGRFNKSARGGPTVFYPNGSELICTGLEDELRAKSGAFGACFIDQAEELTESQVQSIAGRLRHRKQPWRQLGMACNPDSRSHWLFKEFRPDRGIRKEYSTEPIELPSKEKVPAGRLLREIVVSGPRDNVENLPLDYQLFLASLKGRQKLRYVDGLWVNFEGQVFDMWLDELHVRRRPKEWREKWGGYPPPSWPRYRTIDFGYENPFVCQWWARDPIGRYWMYREIYKTHRLVRSHGKRIKFLERQELRTLREIVYENAPTSRLDHWRAKLRYLEMQASVADPSNKEGREQLADVGIWTDPAENDVELGIQTLSRMLGVDGEGWPSVIFVADALDEKDPELDSRPDHPPTCSADEFASYHYPDAKEGRPRDEAPVKQDDHGCDAARGLFHTLEVSGDLGYVRVA